MSCVLPGWTIRHVSTNADDLLGVPAQSLLGANLGDFVDEELLRTIANVAQFSEPGSAPLRAAVGNVGPEAKLYDISVHVVEDLIHLEFEGRLSHHPDPAPTVVAQSMIAHATSVTNQDQFHQLAVERILGSESVFHHGP